MAGQLLKVWVAVQCFDHRFEGPCATGMKQRIVINQLEAGLLSTPQRGQLGPQRRQLVLDMAHLQAGAGRGGLGAVQFRLWSASAVHTSAVWLVRVHAP